MPSILYVIVPTFWPKAIGADRFSSNVITGSISLFKSFLSSSKDESYTGYLRNNLVLLPKISNVVLSTARLTYLCKPLKVDVLLDYNSDFSSETLEEIVSNLAQQLKGVIASDTYEKFAQENLLIE